jgi:hypothetical protein
MIVASSLGKRVDVKGAAQIGSHLTLPHPDWKLLFNVSSSKSVLGDPTQLGLGGESD